MLAHVGLAIVNGLLIGLSRQLNGRLAMSVGPLGASLCNHLLGFGVLAVVVALAGGDTLAAATTAPVAAWLGGVFGALFVAANSLVLSRLGALRTVALVVSGQMLAGLVIDHLARGAALAPLQLAGLLTILAGVIVSRLPAPRPTSPSDGAPPLHRPAETSDRWRRFRPSGTRRSGR